MDMRCFAGSSCAALLAIALACSDAAAAGSSPEQVPDAGVPGTGSGPAHAARPPGIAWFEGDVADAFAAARESHKPVFLYWGAVWCPPCQELKATVFRRRDFQQRLTRFVPVYLDGDGKGAQRWGERFHVIGYPTVLVMRDDQIELERVSGGLDLGRYAQVLDLALVQVHPAREILASLEAAPGQISAADCRLLAFNAWQLDESWAPQSQWLGSLAAALEAAAMRCPDALREERARLQITALEAAALSQEKERKEGKPPGADLRAMMARLPPVLADRKLALSVGDALLGLPEVYFRAGPDSGPKRRAALRRQWFWLMDALSRDLRYSEAEHFYALGAKLLAAKALDPGEKFPADLSADVRRRIDRALAREREPYARSSLVNAALNILDALGDDDRAYAILDGEIRTSANPYYYMSDLAELEEKRGHRDAALDWLARSYHAAQGPATRFQWGARYVRGLVRMNAQDDAAIRAAALEVLGDLDASADLHGRTRMSLEKMESSLREWGREPIHADSILALRERMLAICGKVPAADPARELCQGFLQAG